ALVDVVALSLPSTARQYVVFVSHRRPPHELYPLSLHDALPISSKYFSFSIHLDGPREEHDLAVCRNGVYDIAVRATKAAIDGNVDRKSTRLNSSHVKISYAVFCLKKKNDKYPKKTH